MFVRLESSTGIWPLNELLLKWLYKAKSKICEMILKNLRLMLISVYGLLLLRLTCVSLFSSWKKTLVLVLWCYSHLSGTCSGLKDSRVRLVKVLKVCFHSTAWPHVTELEDKESEHKKVSTREMIIYQVGPAYKSTRDEICPISFGIEPLKLFHMKSLDRGNMKERFQSQ